MTRTAVPDRATRRPPRVRSTQKAVVVAWTVAWLGVAGPSAAAGAESGERPWQLVGRLGLAIYVIVPASAAMDRRVHNAIVDELCPVDQACFLRFFTNSQGRPATLPLADEIEREPTAIFQRSPKYQRQEFRWSCRLKLPDANCF